MVKLFRVQIKRRGCPIASGENRVASARGPVHGIGAKRNLLHEQMCDEAVFRLQKERSDAFGEFMPQLWSGLGCTGRVYPAEGEFPAMDQDLTMAELGLDTMGSIHVPPHVVMDLWSKELAKVSLVGPVTIPAIRHELIRWKMADGTTLPDSHPRYGKPFQFEDVVRFRFRRLSTWKQFRFGLARRGTKEIPVVAGRSLPVHGDQAAALVCGETPSHEGCGCHNAFERLKLAKPDLAGQLMLNLEDASCDPALHYVPTRAKTGPATAENCTTNMRLNMEGEAFAYKDDPLASTEVVCGERSYANTFSNGSGNPLERYSDMRDYDREMRTIRAPSSLVLILLLLATFFLMLLALRQGSRRISSSDREIRRARVLSGI